MSYRTKTIDFLGYFYNQVQSKKFLNQFFSMFWVFNCWNLFIFVKFRVYSNIKMSYKVKIVEWYNHFLKASRHSALVNFFSYKGVEKTISTCDISGPMGFVINKFILQSLAFLINFPMTPPQWNPSLMLPIKIIVKYLKYW